MFRDGQLQGAVSYTIVSAIAAFCVVCLPISAGNSVTKLDVTPTALMSASDVANRIHKADRLSSISFEKRWNAVPASPTGTRNEETSVKRHGLKRISKRSRSAASSHLAVWSRRETLARAVLQPQILLENWLPPRLWDYQDEVG